MKPDGAAPRAASRGPVAISGTPSIIRHWRPRPLFAPGASVASAGGFVVRHGNLAGAITRVGDFRPGYGWDNGGYRNHGVVSPRWIVRNLQRQDYRYISQPVLYGQFYQVRALSPRGHKVKLYIDAYSGRIVRIKA